MAEPITDLLIAGAVASANGSAPIELFDVAEPGLRLRIGAGRARWSYRTFTGEVSRLRISLGAWPDVSLGMARDMAGRLRATFDAPTSGDVVATNTIGDLLGLYQRRRLSQMRKGRVIHRAIANAMTPLARRDASTIGRRDISAIVDGMADRAPIHANRVLAYLKAFFGWAAGRGYIDDNPAAGISKPSREVARDRTPSLDEVAEIWLAAGELGYPFGPIFRLLILTASRRDEVGGMRLEEIDLPADADDGCWVLPAARSKNGCAIRSPLAPLARRTLAQALADRNVAGPYAFSTTGETAVSGWSRAKARLDGIIRSRRLAQAITEPMPHWRLHDLRRAFATASCDLLQVDPAVADRCLNHVGAATTSTVARIYGRSEMYEQRRDALNRWADLVADAVAKPARDQKRTS
jgi:integrase